MTSLGPIMPSYRKRRETTDIILHATHTEGKDGVPIKEFLQAEGRRRGLLDIGYHFLIPRSGKIVETRPHDTQGSHCQGYNEKSIGVVLEGGVRKEFLIADDYHWAPEDNFTTAQREALQFLVPHLRTIYGAGVALKGHFECRGHQDRERQCPPLNMKEVREWVS